MHRAMDTFGAVLGLVIAAVIIYFVQGGGLKLGLETYRWLVLVGVIPAVLAVLVLVVFVRVKRRPSTSRTPGIGIVSGQSGSGFDSRFKVFLAIMVLFTLGNSSDFFVILRAQNR